MNFDDIPQLRDSTSPDSLNFFSNNPLLWISIAVVLIVLILLGLKMIRSRSTQGQINRRVLPFEQGEKALRRLMEEQLNVRKAALESSLVFRHVLQQETGDKALFETHEEFTLRHSALNALPQSLREPTRQYLQKLAHLKYSPDESPGDAGLIIQEGLDLMIALSAKIRQETSDMIQASRQRNRNQAPRA